MQCELCGKNVTVLKYIAVEGCEVNVCDDCARFGVVKVRPVSTGVRKGMVKKMETKNPQERDIFKEIEGEELVEDYPKRIREARMIKGWTQEEMGKKLNEKKSIIMKLESGTIRPDPSLIKKIERCLEIEITKELGSGE